MLRQLLNLLVPACIAAIAFTEPAHAYLDPGTGSMILQGMLGAAAAGLYAVKLQWSRIRAFFESRSAKEKTTMGGE